MRVLRSSNRAFSLRGLLLSSTALVAASLLAPATTQAQSIIISDVRVGQQDLDALLPMGAPRTVLVTSTGSVNAPAAGEAALVSTFFPWTLTNNGFLGGNGFGVSFGSGATITNTGTITNIGLGGPGDTAVFVGGTASITNSGTISGFELGIQATRGTITNSGTVSAFIGNAIDIGGIVPQPGNEGIIINNSVITTILGDGVFLHQGGTVTNNGTITAGNEGIHIDNFQGTIVNNGTINGSGGGGAIVLNAGGTISNTGSISTNAGVSILINGAGTVTNSGSIFGALSGAIQISGAGTVTNQANGDIENFGFGDAVHIGGNAAMFESGKAGTVTNNGRMGGIWLNQGGSITNSGTIGNGLLVSGIRIDNAFGTIINTGTIDLTEGVQLNAGGNVTNSGTLLGNVAIDGLLIQGGNGTVSNSGTIHGKTFGVAILTSGTVTNSGTISSNNATSAGVTIANTGSVANSRFIDGGIQIGGSGTVTNQTGGLLTNGLNATVEIFGAGTVTNQAGATIENFGFGDAVHIGGNAAMFESGKAGTVTNNGRMGGIWLNQGGSITNSGTIGNGLFVSGIRIDNAFGTIMNSGTIDLTEGVRLNQGGIFTNTATGRVSSSSAVTLISDAQPSTITNAGTIFGGVGIFATAIQANGTVTNQAGGKIFADYNAIWLTGTSDTVNNAGLISSGSLALQVDSGTKGVVNNSGTIQTTGSGAAIVVNNASTTITNSGTIASTGALAIDFQGFSLNPHNDMLILQTGSTLLGNVDGGQGIDALILQGSGTENASKFLNFETLELNGTDWTLTGTGTFATSSQITAGTLRVNGNLITPTLTVQTNGTLAGSGTVSGNVMASTGRVAPGPAGTTLSVNGGLTMASASSFLVDIVNTSNSRVDVIGGGHAATLQGGQLGVTFAPPPDTLLNNVQYTVLHADGGVGGTFANNPINFGAYRFTVSYDADDVFLNLTRLTFDSPGICVTANQCAVGGSLERLGPTIPGELGTIIGNLALLDIPVQQAALASLAGSQHATLALLALDGGALFGQSVTRRLTNKRNASQQSADAGSGYNVAMLGSHDGLTAAALPNGAPDANWGAWLRGYGAAGTLSGDLNAAGANYFVGGAAMGIDRQFAPGFTAGLSFGYATTHADFNGSDTSGRINSYDIGVYGSYQRGGFHLDAVASFALLDNKTDRQITVGDLTRMARADYHGQRYGLALESGYDFRFNSVTIQPLLAMNYVHLRQNAFHEDGAGGLDLDGNKSSTDSLRGGAGLRVATQFALGRATIAPELRGRVEHEFLDTRAQTDVNFAGQAPAGAFTVTGAKLPRNSAILGGGMNIAFTQWTSAFVDYDYKFNKDQKIHNLTAGLRFEF